MVENNRSMVNDDKYLLTNRQDAMWGLTATTVGYQSIRSKGIYPPPGHDASERVSLHA